VRHYDSTQYCSTETVFFFNNPRLPDQHHISDVAKRNKAAAETWMILSSDRRCSTLSARSIRRFNSSTWSLRCRPSIDSILSISSSSCRSISNKQRCHQFTTLMSFISCIWLRQMWKMHLNMINPIMCTLVIEPILVLHLVRARSSWLGLGTEPPADRSPIRRRIVWMRRSAHCRPQAKKRGKSVRNENIQ